MTQPRPRTTTTFALLTVLALVLLSLAPAASARDVPVSPTDDVCTEDALRKLQADAGCVLVDAKAVTDGESADARAFAGYMPPTCCGGGVGASAHADDGGDATVRAGYASGIQWCELVVSTDGGSGFRCVH